MFVCKNINITILLEASLSYLKRQSKIEVYEVEVQKL